MTARAVIGVNVRCEIQATVGAEKTVSAVDVDSSGVATVTSALHGLSNGDVIVLTMTEGMDQLDGQAVRVANAATNDFELENIDATDYADFVSGTFVKVATWTTLAKSRQVTAPNPAPAKIDLTVLIDRIKKYTYGLPEAPDGSIEMLFSPAGSAGETIVKAATKANTPRALRITYSGGEKSIFNANLSGGFGFSLQQNQAATSTTAFTPVGEIVHYAS